MAYIHAIAAGDPGWALYAMSVLASVLADALLGILRRGFGRGGFRLIRVLFALLFTTLVGPIVLVALIGFVAYRFFADRRRR